MMLPRNDLIGGRRWYISKRENIDITRERWVLACNAYATKFIGGPGGSIPPPVRQQLAWCSQIHNLVPRSPIYKTDLYSFVYINEDRKTRTIWEEKQPGFDHSPAFFSRFTVSRWRQSKTISTTNTEDSGRPGSWLQGRHLLSVTLDSSTLNIRTYIMIATTIRAAGFAQPNLELDTCWQASRENQHRILVMKLALSGLARFISCVNIVSYGCRPHQNLSLNEISTPKVVQNYR